MTESDKAVADPATLANLLAQAPVMGPLHLLQALCLPPETEVLADAAALAEELDDLAPHAIRPIWLTDVQPRLANRFLQADASAPPPFDAVNRALPGRLDYARRHWLTHRTIADRIVADAAQRRYRTVALLLVDGLGYADVADWPEHVQPCLVDGPSITYYKEREGRYIQPEIGFPGIVGTPQLARRLIEVGLLHSRGFSYWSRETNEVSDCLFEGVPLTRVVRFSEVIAALRNVNLEHTYIQVVREGLDGLAHRRREVTSIEVRETVQAIRADALALLDVLREGPRPAALYLTADHGILWKAEHAFKMLGTDDRAHPRYGTHPPANEESATSFVFDERTFYVYHWPYLGTSIRRNDSGVHGGLSAQESIVPFIRWEIV